MSAAMIVCGIAALMLPGLRSAHVWRGSPQWFVPLNAAALVLGVIAIALGLTVSVGAGVIHVVAGESLRSYGGHLAPGGIAVSVGSSVVLALITARALRFVRHANRAVATVKADSWLGQHLPHHDLDVVIVPTDAVVAYTGRRSSRQVVISEGLRNELDRDAIEFVIDHERSHLRRGHRRYLLLAGAVDATFGLAASVKRSTLALRLAIERVADEDAAGGDPGRRGRAIAGLTVLSNSSATGAPEALVYRARQLATPVARPSRIEAVAGSGLLALAGSVAWLASHTTGDLPALVALLHR